MNMIYNQSTIDDITQILSLLLNIILQITNSLNNDMGTASLKLPNQYLKQHEKSAHTVM